MLYFFLFCLVNSILLGEVRDNSETRQKDELRGFLRRKKFLTMNMQRKRKEKKNRPSSRRATSGGFPNRFRPIIRRSSCTIYIRTPLCMIPHKADFLGCGPWEFGKLTLQSSPQANNSIDATRLKKMFLFLDTKEQLFFSFKRYTYSCWPAFVILQSNLVARYCATIIHVHLKVFLFRRKREKKRHKMY